MTLTVAVDESLKDSEFGIPDDVWASIAPFVSLPTSKSRKGRPRMDDRLVMAAILYRLRTGCSWKALPRQLGAGSTVHGRFQKWRKAGVLEKMQGAGLLGPDRAECL